MQHLKVSGAVRPLNWSLGVKWLTMCQCLIRIKIFSTLRNTRSKTDYRLVCVRVFWCVCVYI